MKRRGFFAGILAAITGQRATAGKAMPRLVQVSDSRLGREVGNPSEIQIILDGQDISADCYRAELYSDGTGTAYCYKRGPDGRAYLVAEVGREPDVAREIRTGKMELFVKHPEARK